MNHEFNELDLGINNEDEFESLLAFLAPIKNDKCSYVDLNFDGILKHIFNCSILHNRIGADTVRDINEMVMFGLCRGDIRKDQLRKTVGGDERIVELAYMYKIPLRSAAGERIRLQSDTLTFVRAVTCFPHVASLFLFKAVELYIYIKPIKSNRFANQYSPSDHAEMKSQPFKLLKITALMAVPGGYGRFLQLMVTSTLCCPLSPLHD
ncbi:hypothetical protein Hanom_Chr09g00838401 [Helianthus anomalus]